jgi:hypothetical protein
MRRKWNSAFYDVTTVSTVEAEQAVRTPEHFLSAVGTDIDSRLSALVQNAGVRPHHSSPNLSIATKT